jgi:hypothetical protein
MKVAKPGLMWRIAGWWCIFCGAIGVLGTIKALLIGELVIGPLESTFHAVAFFVMSIGTIALGIFIRKVVRQVDETGEIPFQ